MGKCKQWLEWPGQREGPQDEQEYGNTEGEQGATAGSQAGGAAAQKWVCPEGKPLPHRKLVLGFLSERV